MIGFEALVNVRTNISSNSKPINVLIFDFLMPQQSVPIPLLPRQKNNAHAVCLACARVKYKAKMSNI